MSDVAAETDQERDERWARLEQERQAREAADVAIIRSWAEDPELLMKLGYRVIGAMTGDLPAPTAWGEVAPELTAREWFAGLWLERAREGVCLECGGRRHLGLYDDEADPIPCDSYGGSGAS